MKAVSGKRFCKIVEEHGWIFRRVASSHHIYSKPGNPLVLSVPVHGNRDLKPGMLRGLMRQAGLTETDL